jgi:hypothetical protein
VETAAAAKAAEAAAKPVKEKFRTRSVKYLKNIYMDYLEVGKDSYKKMGQRPFKSLAYGLGMTSVLVLYKTTPTQLDYENKRIELMNELIMCGATHSSRAEYYLCEINKLENLELIEYKWFVFFSLIMVKKFSEADCNYEKACAQLNNPNKFNIFNSLNLFLRYISRIIDIGVGGRWLYLNKYFVDFDVDEREWFFKKINK